MLIVGQSNESGPVKPGTIAEPARHAPIVAEADVVVCGGGPAGVAAAVAAARRGAKTQMLKVHGCLGGIWTAGALGWLLDHANKKGFMPELLDRLARSEGLTLGENAKATNAYDVEVMKVVLDQLVQGAGVQIQLHTRVCAAAKDEYGRLAHVITESKSGRQAFAGKVFLDCTGDGDLGVLAGCGFDVGHWARWPTTNPRFEPAETLVVAFLREHRFIERE